jgi:7-cyano-7-deazaguanine synthase
MDSATCLAIAQRDGFEVTALTVDYGQRHRVEIACARVVARARGVQDHRVVQVDLREIGGSALTGSAAVPKDRLPETIGASIGANVPITYVPARNTMLLSLALGLAEVVEAGVIYIGATAIDYSGYPDCRPEFLRAFEALARLGTARGMRGDSFEIRAPLIALSKAEIARLGSALGIDYGQTSSCYDPSSEGVPCGRCDSCLLRAKGFAEAGLIDPAQTRRREE